MNLAPRIDLAWVHPEHQDETGWLTLRLPVEGCSGQIFQLGIGGISWIDRFDSNGVSHEQLLSIEARWDTLVVRDRSGGVHKFELRMTGPELANLVTAMRRVLSRCRERVSPVWRAGPPAKPAAVDSTALIDPRWIPQWARNTHGDRLHITFPSEIGPDGRLLNSYLRLRAADIAWPSQGRLQLHPLSAIRQVRSRAEAIEILLHSGEVWARPARMEDRDRYALVEAIRAFIARHLGPEVEPPEALIRLVNRGS